MLPPYQQAILSFFARSKGPDDSIILFNGRLRWKSEFVQIKAEPPSGPLRGIRAHAMIIDDLSYQTDPAHHEDQDS